MCGITKEQEMQHERAQELRILDPSLDPITAWQLAGAELEFAASK